MTSSPGSKPKLMNASSRESVAEGVSKTSLPVYSESQLRQRDEKGPLPDQERPETDSSKQASSFPVRKGLEQGIQSFTRAAFSTFSRNTT